MTYRLEIKRSVEKQIRRLPVEMLPKVNEHILALRDNPRPLGAKKLVGGLGWRVRVGDWRIVYEIDDERRVLTIYAVRPRQSAYK